MACLVSHRNKEQRQDGNQVCWPTKLKAIPVLQVRRKVVNVGEVSIFHPSIHPPPICSFSHHSPVHPSVHPSIIHSSFHLSSTHLPIINPSLHLCTHSSIIPLFLHPSVYLSTHSPTYSSTSPLSILPIYPPFDPSIHSCIH